MPDTKTPAPKPYTVVEDRQGCSKCGHGHTWTVLGPGNVAEGVSYDDREDADATADALNEAFAQGQLAGKS